MAAADRELEHHRAWLRDCIRAAVPTLIGVHRDSDVYPALCGWLLAEANLPDEEWKALLQRLVPKPKGVTLWCEGYAATGESAPARFCGTFPGPTLREAVEQYAITLKPEARYRIRADAHSCTDWGCRFFDNELDARKMFG